MNLFVQARYVSAHQPDMTHTPWQCPQLSIDLLRGMSIVMSTHGLTIVEAASSLGVSSRTIRRLIKSGKLSAELVPGPFGDEYRIFELPTDYCKRRPVDNTPTQIPIQTTSQTPVQFMDIIRELQEKNMVLAAQLGAATEHIRFLENQVKLLNTTKQPWWKRLFIRKE